MSARPGNGGFGEQTDRLSRQSRNNPGDSARGARPGAQASGFNSVPAGGLTDRERAGRGGATNLTVSDAQSL